MTFIVTVTSRGRGNLGINLGRRGEGEKEGEKIDDSESSYDAV